MRSVEHALRRVERLEKLVRSLNPFRDSNVGMAKLTKATPALERARLDLWRLGQCCRDRRDWGDCGRCHCRSVELARFGKLLENGMAKRNAGPLSEYCERSEDYQLIQVALGAARDADISIRDLIRALKSEALENHT